MTKEYAAQILREMQPKFARYDREHKQAIAIRMALEALQERKTGKWIVSQVDGQFHCSACNHLLWNTAVLALGGLPNACPWCTVKMEVEE